MYVNKSIPFDDSLFVTFNLAHMDVISAQILPSITLTPGLYLLCRRQPDVPPPLLIKFHEGFSRCT